MPVNGLIKFAVVSIWLATMGWLVRFEAFPHLFDPTLQGYRELSKHLPALRDSWMKILANGRHVGYINSSVEMLDEDGEEQLQMSTQLQLRLKIQGRVEMLRLTNEVRLDARQNLLSSYSTFSMGTFSGSLELLPTAEADRFAMTAELNDLQFKRGVQLPKGAVIASPFMDSGLRMVKVGRTVKIRSMNPFSPAGELSTIEITGISKEDRQLPGESRSVEVTLMSMKAGNWVMEAEVDEYGRILRQETPFGLTFVHSEANSAMKIPEESWFDPGEILSGTSLPSMMKFPGNPL